MPRRNNRDDYGVNWCACITIPLWLLVNVADAWWIYFYVEAHVNPVPRNAVSRSHSAYTGFQVLMFMFGFCWGIANAFMMWIIIAATWDWGGKGFTMKLWALIEVFLVIPIGIVLIIMPFFGGWIVSPIVQKRIWEHGCDGYPMMVILDGKSVNDPRYVVNVAYFYDNTNAASPTELFTYEITNPDDDDEWVFTLRTWDTPQSLIPVDMYPTLQHVYYNFIDNSIAGNCTLPNVASPTQNTTTAPCLSGSYDAGSQLSFALSSSVPLNTTLAADASKVSTANTTLGIGYSGWDFYGYHPAVRLQERDVRGKLGHLVLDTTVNKVTDATELKVCVSGPEGREGATVSAEVLAPLGLMLIRQADYAVYATTSNDNAST